MSIRDRSRASQAANLRITGATRIHCDDYDWMHEEGQSDITERRNARGDMEENQREIFNRRLRGGQKDERL